MWDANDDDDAAFEGRINPVLKEIGDRCKAVTSTARQQLHEPAPAPTPAPTLPAGRAQNLTSAAGAHGITSSSLRTQQREQEASKGPAVTMVHQMPSAASCMASGSFAEMAAFFREEREQFNQERAQFREERAQCEAKLEAQRAQFEAKLDAERAQCDAKLDAQRQAWEARLETQRQELEKVWEAKLEAQRQSCELRFAHCHRDALEARELRLQARFEALHASKLLSDDELYILENLVVDNLEGSESAGEGGERHSTVSSLVRLSERVASDAGLARQLRRKYI
jgi:hypothetical protein